MAEEGVNIREVQERMNTSPQPQVSGADSDFMALVRQRNQEKYSQQQQQTDNEDSFTLQRPSLLDSRYDVPTTPVVEPVEVEADPEVTTTEGEPQIEDPIEEKRKNKETNMKALRNSLKASRDRVAELEEQISAKDKELERLSEIDDLKSQLAERDERLKKLQSYEDMVSLYGTEGFKEKFYDSVDDLRDQAVSLAADYGVPEDVIDTAMGMTNQRQLNDYLAKWFDTFAVQDIRGYIKDAQQIISDREVAEAEPAKAREMLLNNVAKRREAERVQSRENVKSAGTSAWADMVATYGNKESGVALLQEKEGNKSHNAVRANILQSASAEYGKMLAVLADNGLKELPVSAARALAARFQLGESTAFAMVQAENLRKEVQELKAELKKFTDYQRPLSNGKVNSSNVGDSNLSELSGKDLAKHLYSTAASKVQSVRS